MSERRGTKALELWCRRMTEGYPGVKVDNMTTSWRDGLAFCAMIHHFRPDLIEFEKLTKSDVYYNNALAFTTAEKYLGIPALLDADDMAAYEVPDRLSILTYLSQFYQVFAAQDAHNRLKRPSSSATDKTQITKPAGPPSKMAHVVGVPRRDPCRKCQLPVFLAERLMVGKKVYHRTCLKCARCGSQLTPGSFYETETDEQYCCETCPDEEIVAPNPISGELSPVAAAVGGIDSLEAESSEVQLRNTFERDSARSPSSFSTNTRSVRSSIKDRLAFFEQQQHKRDESSFEVDNKLLQKSLSDEEKSKSLQRMENSANGATPSAVYKMNPALSSFLNDTVDNEPVEENANNADEEDDESESLASSQQNPKMETSDSEETDEFTSTSQAPELPKSLPPAEAQEPIELKPADTKRFTASAQLVLGTATNIEQHIIADDQENIVRALSPEKPSAQLEISITSLRKTNDSTNNNVHDDELPPPAKPQEVQMHETPQKMTEEIQHIELENNLACNETNDNDCVTKDKATDDVSMEMEADTVAAQQLESTTISHDNLVAVTKSSQLPEKEQIKTSDQEVELRTKSPEAEREVVATAAADDSETTQRLSVVRARLQQFEVITNNEKEKDTDKELTTATNDNKEVAKDNSHTPPKTTPANGNEISSRLELENEKTLNLSQPEEEEKMETQTEALTEVETVTEILTENTTTLKDIDHEVPFTMETKDNDDEILENKSMNKPQVNETSPQEEEEDVLKSTTSSPEEKRSKTPEQSANKLQMEEYPEDLNPFKSDEEDEDADHNKENMVVLRKPPIPPQPTPSKVKNLNPFDSSDDEIELEKSQSSRASMASTPKIPPPRPPPPRISRNPFGSEDEEEGTTQSFPRRSSLTSSSQSKRTPVPAPRSNVSQSQNPTPEPTPRLSTKITTNFHQHHPHLSNSNTSSATTTPQSNSYILQNSSDFYGSANSLHSSHTNTPNNLLRNSDIRSSNNSLNLSAGGTIRSRKSRRAPLPPAPVKELFPSSETVNSSSKASTPSSSTVGTPKSGRKKRPAPAPPKPARLEPSAIPQIQVDTAATQSKNSLNYPLQSELDSKLSDEEKALLEGKTLQSLLNSNDSEITLSPASRRSSKRLIPLDKDLLEEHLASQCDDLKQQQNLHKSYNQQEDEEANVVYRRLLIPHIVDTPTHESNPLLDELNRQSVTVGERQLEKLKDNKEANNRNRQSQISAASSGAEDNDPLYNKSVHGKWKRRKGPAPALPIPPRKVLQMLPLQEIKHELEIIEVQQQGLEKQGVVLEKMIRDRCEDQNGEPLNAAGEVSSAAGESTADGSSLVVENSKEVEYLILQLFELVNEKNELFRRQAELMYLRRQHRLEQEQADLEYEIRVLMAQPERNKTDSDKAREEALIERLVEVVQLRNEVVECLEMDRIREAEEDQSIKQRLESHIAQREEVPETKKTSTLSKLSKKEKKKQKESKKLGKSKKLDADKDADESEMSSDKQKTKKKKKLLIF